MSEDTRALLAVVLTGMCTGVLTVCGVTELEKETMHEIRLSCRERLIEQLIELSSNINLLSNLLPVKC